MRKLLKENQQICGADKGMQAVMLQNLVLYYRSWMFRILRAVGIESLVAFGVSGRIKESAMRSPFWL